jgi:hypothetical protein
VACGSPPDSQLRKEQHPDAVLQFVAFWKKRTGHVPEELIFDSKLTTYARLNQLNHDDVHFITLRRRSPSLLRQVLNTPASAWPAWRRIELHGVSRQYKHPKVLDQRITLPDYDGRIRQLLITDLGHEEPTVLLTNHLHRSPAKLIERYAQRMLIENNIEDGIDFFHMDALSSAVAMKVNCDLQLTLMASSFIGCSHAASATATRKPNPVTCLPISSTPRHKSTSAPATSKSAFTSGPTIPICSAQNSRRQTKSSPGWGKNACAWPSDNPRGVNSMS